MSRLPGKRWCSNVLVMVAEPTLPPPVDIPNAAGCSDIPLRRVRVELWEDNVLPGPSAGDSLLVSTATDANGVFAFCRTSAPNDEVDIYVSVKTCADGTTDGDACGTRSGTPTQFSVVTTTPGNEVFTTHTATVDDVCTGSIHWDIVDRRALHNGGQNIFDLLANDTFDFLENEVGWSNAFRLQVRFPDSATGFSTSDEIVHIASGDEQDPDVILRAYSFFVLHQLYDKSFPSVTPACASSAWGVSSDPSCAWIKGAAIFLQAAIQDDSLFEDTSAPEAPADLEIDMEVPTPAVNGREDEGAVAASLWDVFDTSAEPWDDVQLGLGFDLEYCAI